MNAKITLGVVVILMTLGTTAGSTLLLQHTPESIESGSSIDKIGHNGGRAPPAITEDNIYVAWWTNKTGNNEVLFRVSTDKG